MTVDLQLLALTAMTLGVVHTAAGPDHYLPFVALARAGRWSLRRTIIITLLCGVGHLVGSVVLGFVGIATGLGVSALEPTEASRGEVAAWLLMGFGLVYCIWGVVKALRPHVHSHTHDHALTHSHTHTHLGEHHHDHEDQQEVLELQSGQRKNVAWALFVVFVLGPCEPLIPLLMYPAAQQSTAGVVVVTLLFSLATLLTMLGFVLVGTLGLRHINLGPVERYSHAVAGGLIFLSGGAIQFLGL